MDSTTTLASMQDSVTQAENNGGGWVQFVFHGICDGCGDTSATSPAQLSAFLDWLQPRAANGTVVRTVGDVMGAGRSGFTAPAPNPAPDTTAPVSSITCNDGSCDGFFATARSVALAATDAGSGVAAIRYTTDGSDPSTSSSTTKLYSAPFSLAATTTVKYRAYDRAGNVEPVATQMVRFDYDLPTAAITSPASGSTVRAGTYVPVAVTAQDTGGSGVAKVSVYVDGVLVGTDTSAPYSVVWTPRRKAIGQHTIVAEAEDGAGNLRRSTSVTVTVTR